ncbi:MAG: hypothetical protein DKT66_23085 [Candidatus Melainabacteria bacterium]|nr:MAG: hypothetical protein DKT66_23085 [Candidatus Melainabacteria bacterium]
MNRVLLSVISFFTVFGLAVGWRLPHILEQQACEEFLRRKQAEADQYFVLEYNDNESSCKLPKEIISFFDLHKDDVTIPQCLDFCAAAMKAYGHNTAARQLYSKARQIREQ